MGPKNQSVMMRDGWYSRRIQKLCDDLSKECSYESRAKIHIAHMKFIESFFRLEERLNEMVPLRTHELINGEVVAKELPRSLDEEQLSLMNKIEAFHQQAYVVLSAFAHLLNCAVGPNFKRGLSINSIKKFLEHIKSVSDDPILNELVDILLTSREYRSRFVDHPQLDKTFNWVTFSRGDESMIIYYIPKREGGISRPEEFDGNSFDFDKPITREDFFTSPSCIQTFESLIIFVDKVLTLAVERQ